MVRSAVVIVVGVVLVVALVLPGAAQSVDDVTKSSKFVQDFYNYYLKLCEKEGKKEGPLEIAIREKPGSMSTELVKALNEDLAAAAKNPGEIVGLDFDPVLNAQDMASKYVVGKATLNKGTVMVEVYGFWNGKKSQFPDVVPEVMTKNGKCSFVNFHYKNEKGVLDNDLLTVLKGLKAEREKQKK